MNAIKAIERILTLGLSNNVCGTIETSDSAIDVCQLYFGNFHPILSPRPNTTYLYEWRKADSPNEIGEPDALLIQPSFDGAKLIYLYELTND